MKVFMNKFFSKYKFNSILFVNFLKIFFVMFVILCISCITIYTSMMRISKNEMLLYNEINAKNMIETTENVLNEIKNLTLNIVVDTDVRNYIMSENEETILTGYQTRLISKMSAYKNMTKYVDSVLLYNESNNTVLTHNLESKFDEDTNLTWFDIYKSNPDDTMVIVPHKADGKYPYLLTYMSAIEGKGCVVVTVDIYQVAKYANSAYNGKYSLYITDENNLVIYSNDESKFMTTVDEAMFGKTFSEGEDVFELEDNTYYGYSMEDNNRKYIVTALINDYSRQTGNTGMMLIFAMALIFVFGIFISGVLALNAFEPISKLIHFVDAPNENRLLDELKNNEVKYIVTKILAFVDSSTELKQELDNRLSEHNKLSMMAMQMQINPHFLNNSLNLIGLKLAKELGAENSSTIMVTSLTRLIRYVLNSDTIFVDFRQELSFLRTYIDFLNYRYKNLRVVWDIDAEVYNCKIMRVCLQPLVENAVYHGLSAVDYDRILKISAGSNENNLIISVEDNGMGMDEKTLDEVIGRMKSTEFTSRHIGIKNVYRRLKIVYGESADIKIETEAGSFTRVTVIMPKEF